MATFFCAPALLSWRTIARNISLPLEIIGMSREERQKRIQHTINLVGLEGFRKISLWQLSGGMQQRASIARALAFDADLLLMDEPFGALDEIVRDHLNEQLLQLLKKTQERQYVLSLILSLKQSISPQKLWSCLLVLEGSRI